MTKKKARSWKKEIPVDLEGEDGTKISKDAILDGNTVILTHEDLRYLRIEPEDTEEADEKDSVDFLSMINDDDDSTVEVVELTESEVATLDQPKVLTGDEKLYFDKLCSILVQIKQPTYKHLLYRLWLKEFYWTVDYDENRESYALDMRQRFGFNRHRFGKARVLEILITLTEKLTADTKGFPGYMGFRKGFWKLIDNMGLLEYDDAGIAESDKIHTFDIDIDAALNRFLDRTYDENGQNGGLFPLQKAPKDLRKVELWYQLQYYVSSLNTK